jgi:actin-like ATPase involved in cell morphogenesis
MNPWQQQWYWIDHAAKGNMIADSGGTTEIAVIALGGIVCINQ